MLPWRPSGMGQCYVRCQLRLPFTNTKENNKRDKQENFHFHKHLLLSPESIPVNCSLPLQVTANIFIITKYECSGLVGRSLKEFVKYKKCLEGILSFLICSWFEDGRRCGVERLFGKLSCHVGKGWIYWHIIWKGESNIRQYIQYWPIFLSKSNDNFKSLDLC